MDKVRLLSRCLRTLNINTHSNQSRTLFKHAGVVTGMNNIVTPNSFYSQKVDPKDNQNKYIGSITKLEDRGLTLSLNSGEEMYCSYVWLRDNAPHSSTFELGERTKARTLLMTDLHTECKPNNASVTADGNLTLKWEEIDEPIVYPSKWLLERWISHSQFRKNRQSFHEWATEPWGSQSIQQQVGAFDWQKMVETPEKSTELLSLLKSLLKYGLARVVNMPKEVGQLEVLSDILGYMHHSNYGSVFEVKVEATPSNLAYTPKALGFHTDLPYMINPPDVQVLHVVHQAAKGGANIFVDGLNVARQLRDEKPEVYKMLTTFEQEFLDDGKTTYQFIISAMHPTIALDAKKEPCQVFFNNQQRSWFTKFPDEHKQQDVNDQIHEYYSALKTFSDYMHQQRNLFELKLNAGEMILFGNNRVLHGRRAYASDPDAQGVTRHLQGCYFSFDAVHSKIRVIQENTTKLRKHAAFAV